MRKSREQISVLEREKAQKPPTHSNKRPKTAKEKTLNQDESNNVNKEDGLFILRKNVPRVNGSSGMDIENLRAEALHAIIDNRLYTDHQLYEFFEMIKEANPAIPSETLDKMLLEFVKELDS